MSPVQVISLVLITFLFQFSVFADKGIHFFTGSFFSKLYQKSFERNHSSVFRIQAQSVPEKLVLTENNSKETEKSGISESDNYVQQLRTKRTSDDLKYILVVSGRPKIFEELNPQSPILGFAKKGSTYPLLKEGKSWCTISYKGRTGWIEKEYVTVVDQPSASPLIIKEVIMYGGSALGIVFVISFVFMLVNRSNKVKDEWFSAESRTRKLILVSGNKTTLVTKYLTNSVTTLENCFTEIGFKVIRANNGNTLLQQICHASPDAIAVNWQINPKIQEIIEQILITNSIATNVFVLFFNVSDPVNARRNSNIFNAAYLGISFNDRDLFKIITPLLTVQNRSQGVHKSIENSALQGHVSDHSLTEVLQFIEIGKKTGCLLIHEEKPIGIIYFMNGIIIYAASPSAIGKKAIFQLLNWESGQFHFVLNRKPKSSNCSIPILEILMEWAKVTDETTGNRLR